MARKLPQRAPLSLMRPDFAPRCIARPRACGRYLWWGRSGPAGVPYGYRRTKKGYELGLPLAVSARGRTRTELAQHALWDQFLGRTFRTGAAAAPFVLAALGLADRRQRKRNAVIPELVAGYERRFRVKGRTYVQGRRYDWRVPGGFGLDAENLGAVRDAPGLMGALGGKSKGVAPPGMRWSVTSSPWFSRSNQQTRAERARSYPFPVDQVLKDAKTVARGAGVIVGKASKLPKSFIDAIKIGKTK